MSNVFIPKTYYKILKINFAENNLKWHHLDTESPVRLFETDDLVKDLENIQENF